MTSKVFHLTLSDVLRITPPLPSSGAPENSIQAFGNGSDDRTASSHPATPPPATETLSAPPVPTAPVSMETEQSILRAQIPTQENDRLWGDEEDSTLPSPGLSDASSKPSLGPLLLGTALLLPGPLFHLLLLSA
ncbi:unnamed protein product [Gadus morhua 'NCC']